MKIVTSYNEPDLDGVSCMYAYTELLNLKGERTKYFIWNKPKQEVEIVCNLFGIGLNGLKEEEISKEDEFIIVDLNGKEQMYEKIKTNKIVEIIDHHGLSKWLPFYTSIKRVQIDRLGATATIVVERYRLNGIIPSRESAILLYYGIISNSINLKANVTNQRDIDACKWLKSICNEISDEKIKEIFIKKSIIKDSGLRAEMECEIPNTFQNFKTIVAQLEIANLEGFIVKNKDNIIQIMQEVKKEKEVEYIFCNCIDILNGYIMVLVPDNDSKEFVEKTFGYSFDKNNIANVDRIIQRKDMTQILREKYNPKKS